VLPSDKVIERLWKGKVEGLGRPPPREIMPGMAIKGVSALEVGIRRVASQ
jgi:hypothetical protein